MATIKLATPGVIFWADYAYLVTSSGCTDHKMISLHSSSLLRGGALTLVDFWTRRCLVRCLVTCLLVTFLVTDDRGGGCFVFPLKSNNCVAVYLVRKLSRYSEKPNADHKLCPESDKTSHLVMFSCLPDTLERQSPYLRNKFEAEGRYL